MPSESCGSPPTLHVSAPRDAGFAEQAIAQAIQVDRNATAMDAAQEASLKSSNTVIGRRL